jgi:hypothetical protein
VNCILALPRSRIGQHMNFSGPALSWCSAASLRSYFEGDYDRFFFILCKFEGDYDRFFSNLCKFIERVYPAV